MAELLASKRSGRSSMLPPRNYAPRNRSDRLRSPTHQKFIRQHLCVAWERKECVGKVECCHARDLVPYHERHGAKPSDQWTYPACRVHHGQAEKREEAFGHEYGLDMRAICLGLAAQSPDKAIREAAKEQGNGHRDGQDARF